MFFDISIFDISVHLKRPLLHLQASHVTSHGGRAHQLASKIAELHPEKYGMPLVWTPTLSRVYLALYLIR